MKTLWAALLLGAATAAQASGPAAPKPPADPNKKICRAEDVTGSLFPKRVCHTRAEWVEVTTRQQVQADRYATQKDMSGHALPLSN